MMMVFCYAPYALAEGLHLSGMNSSLQQILQQTSKVILLIWQQIFQQTYQSHSLELPKKVS